MYFLHFDYFDSDMLPFSWNSRPVVLRLRPNHYIQAVIDAEVVPRVVQLLRHESAGVHTPALRTVGNLVTGDDLQTDMVLNNDPFGAVMQLGIREASGDGDSCGSKLGVVTCCDMFECMRLFMLCI